MPTKRSKGGNRLKSLLTNTGIFIVALFGCLATCELITRLIYKERMLLFPRYHAKATYGPYKIRRLQPNIEFWHTSPDGSWKFTTNSQGFRSHEDFSYKKHQGVLRVISLGDSHTEGFEVRQDYTYSSVIEKYLRRHGCQAEVLNTGISGFSTAEELAFLGNEGIRYDPDYVVLGFFANDFDDNIKAGLFELNNGDLCEKKKEHVPGVRIQEAIFKTLSRGI